MAGWIKMPLGTEVGLGPGHDVLYGDSAPPERDTAALSLFLARVYCSQTVAHLSYCWALVMTYYVRVISLWLTKIRNRSIELLSFWQYVPVWRPSLSKFENLPGWQGILLQRRTEEHCLDKHNIDFCFLEGKHVCSCVINMKSVHRPIVVDNTRTHQKMR